MKKVALFLSLAITAASVMASKSHEPLSITRIGKVVAIDTNNELLTIYAMKELSIPVRPSRLSNGEVIHLVESESGASGDRLRIRYKQSDGWNSAWIKKRPFQIN